MSLRTTLIVGFPGETDEEFRELVDFVREFKFDRLGVFAYSHEEGTTASKLKDTVPEKVKQARLEELMLVQQEVSHALNEAKVGKTFKTVIDRKEGDHYIGRTEYDSPEVDNEVIVSPGNTEPVTGRFYPVRIEKADYFDLFGTIVTASWPPSAALSPESENLRNRIASATWAETCCFPRFSALQAFQLAVLSFHNEG